MLFAAMRDGEDFRTPEEQLEQLDVLRHLDGRDVVSEALRAGDEAPAEDVTGQPAQRRALWLGLRLALIITLGVVLIVAAWFRYKVPDYGLEPQAAAPALNTAQLTRLQELVSQVCDWRHPTDYNLTAPVIGTDGTIYETNSFKYGTQQMLMALAPDGTLKWQHENPSQYFSWTGPRATADGRLLVLDWESGQLTSLTAGGDVVWEVGLDGARYLALNSARDRIYADGAVAGAGGRSDAVHAFDLQGHELWHCVVPGGIRSSQPVSHFGLRDWPALTVGPTGEVFVMSTSGGWGEPSILSAVSPAGELLWSHELPNEHQRRQDMYIGKQRFDPDEYEGTDKVPDFDPGVISYRTVEADTDDRYRCILPAPEGGCYAVTVTDAKYGGKLLAFGADGALRWTAELGIPNFAEPLLGPDGTIYLSCAPPGKYGREFQVRAIDPRDGGARWVCPTSDDGTLGLGPDGSLYLSTHQQLWAIGAEGMVRWTASKGMYFSPPHVAPDGTVLLSGEFGLVCYAPDGSERFSLELADYGPQDLTLAPDGRIYLVLNDSELVAISR